MMLFGLMILAGLGIGLLPAAIGTGDLGNILVVLLLPVLAFYIGIDIVKKRRRKEGQD